MKIQLLIIAVLAPSLAFSQTASFNAGGLIGGVIAFAIMILIFLLLREVVMWYWKINTIIDNQALQIRTQQETNNLLSEQISLIKTYYSSGNNAGPSDGIKLNKSEDL